MKEATDEGDMALVSGKYYSQDGVTYLCNKDTVNPVYNPLRQLVGVVADVVCYKCGDS